MQQSSSTSTDILPESEFKQIFKKFIILMSAVSVLRRGPKQIENCPGIHLSLSSCSAD